MKTSAFKGDFKLTSAYGWRTHPITGVKAFHNGVDFGMVTGSELIVPPKFNNSVVRLTLTDKYGGKYLQLQNKSNGKGYYVLHISSFKKKVGDTVKTGDLIALSGNTGNSTGAHTHIGVQKDATVWGSCEDPMPYIILENTQMFKKGDKIIITQVQHIRKGQAGAVQGSSIVGQTGVIYDNPREAVLDGVNYTWYDIHFDGGGSGWLADVGKFEKYVAPIIPEPPVAPDCKKYIEQIDTLNKEIEGLKMGLGSLEELLGDKDKQLGIISNELRMANERIELLEENIKNCEETEKQLEGELKKAQEEARVSIEAKLKCQEEYDKLKLKCEEGSNLFKKVVEWIVKLFKKE